MALSKTPVASSMTFSKNATVPLGHCAICFNTLGEVILAEFRAAAGWTFEMGADGLVTLRKLPDTCEEA